jgi:hypothetical protein
VSLTWWHRFWLIWFLVPLSLFLVAEIYALCTDWRRTLSAAVWHFEHFRAGQPVNQWSAAHFLFIGVLFLIDVWLLGHFAFGWWRS